MDIITDEMEKDFTVDQMIGVVKYIRLTNKGRCSDYLEQLEYWSEIGCGEVSVTSCREIIDL